ncbi:MAG: SLC45 family MFS transporter [Caldilineaceae bacterium]|nr:SLC45 family MFS transporter [Caldilineaceae bacterium]MBP8106825.1 SLC45 family MFS transporter [Caldilineaceae bacterium]MBP8121719.1 SLC45 family MFS transporter [Caldilineaceae bacterium]MBP9071491.1 SLC45 family MFS transporter [Caldilineaceae bacterium]
MNKFPYGRTLLLGFGFFGISIIWPLFNTFVPVFLKEDFALSATLIGFIMTWDNYANMFLQPLVGERSDRTRSRWGRRKPWIMVGAPLAAVFFVLVPTLGTVPGIMVAILLTNLSMAIFRSPTVALLGDLFPPEQRSTANGVINLMGGLGAIAAFLGGGYLYSLGRITPFIFGAVVMVGALLMVVLLIQEPEIPQPKEEEDRGAGLIANVRAVLTNPDRSGLMILLAILCWFMGYNALDTWISSFGRFDLNIDIGRMAMITSGFAALFVVFAVPSGLIATRYGRKRIIMIGIIGLSSLFVFGWFIQSQTMLIIMLVLAGIFWALINVNSLPMVFDVGGEDKLGAYTGLYYFAASIAAIAGPQTVGFLVDLTGASYRIMFVFSAVFMILAGIFMSQVKEKKQIGGK